MKLNKKQKRTATIASMAALLAVVLGMGGQTFAKYVTTNTAPASQATIAKWGVVIKNTVEAGTEVFKDDYGTVKSSDARDVVAPNTSGTYGLLVTGNPEVKVKVTIDLTIQDIFVETAEGTYYPIVWTLNGQKFNGATAASDLESAVDSIETYAANKNLTEVNFTLSWEWAFDNSTKASTEVGYNAKANDFDTLLGDIAAGESVTYDDAETTLKVGVTATVEQVEA